MTEEKNEFEDLSAEESTPEQEFSETPDGQEEIIASGSAGTVYDWNKAPEGTKAPPRIDLDGQELILKKADIILPPADREWQKTKGGDKDFKYCTFVLSYEKDGQQEFYSGLRVFKREENKYSHPTLTRDRKNQASKLFGLYADYKKKDINEVNLKEFMAFLNSKPKLKIQTEVVENPENGNKITKNMVGSFVND